MPTNEHKTCQQPWEVDGAVSASVCALIEQPDEERSRVGVSYKCTTYVFRMNVQRIYCIDSLVLDIASNIVFKLYFIEFLICSLYANFVCFVSE